MPDPDHLKRTVAEWTERKLREAAALPIAAYDASLAIMDEFTCPASILVDKDLWISRDYQEWCIHFRFAGESIVYFVNERTLSHLAQKTLR